jgi:hypothetical protein
MLQRLKELCPGRPEAIRPEDWKALKGLSSLSAPNVEQLFYPGAPPETLIETIDDEAKGHQYRSPKLLTRLTHAEYHAAYTSIQQKGVDAVRFPDVEAILAQGRKEGPVLSQVMSQIARWINPKPADVESRQNGKPPHWQDFVPAFKAVPLEEAERVAQQLQRDIFDVVRGRWNELDGILEGDVSRVSYVTRFKTPIWHDLLVVVHKAVGPRFVGHLARANKEVLPPRPSSTSKPALVRSIGEALCRVPQVSRNPALQDPAALEQLVERISPVIAEWAVSWCDQGLKAQADAHTPQWAPSVLELVQQERLAMGELVPATSVAAHPSTEGESSPTRVAGSTPTKISPEPSLVVSSPPRSPTKQITALPVPSSDTISGLLTLDAETMEARRKAFRESRPRPQQKFKPPGASRRPTLVTPTRIDSPATTTTRQKLPWTSGPATRPYREIS